MIACSPVENPSDEDMDRRPLTVDDVHGSLSVLGHNADGLLVYAQSNLSSLGLTSIGALSTYKHLQRLVLDNNALVSLRPLRELRFLVCLSAQNNRLDDGVFEDLAASGNTLDRLKLRNNRLTSLNGLRHLPFLLELFAEENEITELRHDNFCENHNLIRLNLRFNCIERVHLDTFSDSKTLRILNLSHNAISNTDFVLHLASTVEALDLEYNKIQNLSGFKRASELVRLHLAHNRIREWKELKKLASMGNLCELSLERNPILQGKNPRPQSSCAFQNESGSQVAQDVQFTATADSGLLSSNKRFNDTFLSSMVAPSVRGLVQHLTAPAQETELWDDDNQVEMARLSFAEQNRFRVISALPHLLYLDGTKVAPEDLPRAVRLFGNRKSKLFASDKVPLPAGSAVKAVESRRIDRVNIS